MKNIAVKTRTTSYRVGRSRAGLGLFAAQPFKKGVFVIEYSGERITNATADERNSKYLFAFDSRWTIDGAGRENLSRYLNHSCRPNCEAYIEGKGITIYALRDIKIGEELTYDYGKEYFDEYIKPFGCRCDHCRGKKR